MLIKNCYLCFLSLIQYLTFNNWYWRDKYNYDCLCGCTSGLWDPHPPSGLAGGDADNRLQDDLCRSGIQPQAAETGCPGGPGLPHTFLQPRQVQLAPEVSPLFDSFGSGMKRGRRLLTSSCCDTSAVGGKDEKESLHWLKVLTQGSDDNGAHTRFELKWFIKQFTWTTQGHVKNLMQSRCCWKPNKANQTESEKRFNQVRWSSSSLIQEEMRSSGPHLFLDSSWKRENKQNVYSSPCPCSSVSWKLVNQ